MEFREEGTIDLKLYFPPESIISLCHTLAQRHVMNFDSSIMLRYHNFSFLKSTLWEILFIFFNQPSISPYYTQDLFYVVLICLDGIQIMKFEL